MNLREHLVVSGVAATALLPVWRGEEIALFATASVLIDVDHYFIYVQRRRRFDLSGMFRYFNEINRNQGMIPYGGLCIFHTIDFFLLMGVLTIRYPSLYPVLAGLLFHFVVDCIDLYRRGIPFIRAYFLVEHFIRRRNEGYPFC
jgi:hypothetical protein